MKNLILAAVLVMSASAFATSALATEQLPLRRPMNFPGGVSFAKIISASHESRWDRNIVITYEKLCNQRFLSVVHEHKNGAMGEHTAYDQVGVLVENTISGCGGPASLHNVVVTLPVPDVSGFKIHPIE